MPPTSDGIRTVGCSLQKLVPDAGHLDAIQKAVASTHKATFLATELLNMHMRRMLVVPDADVSVFFNANWLLNAYNEVTVVKRKVKRVEELHETLDSCMLPLSLRAMGGEGGGDGKEDTGVAALHTTRLHASAQSGQERRHQHRHQLDETLRGQASHTLHERRGRRPPPRVSVSRVRMNERRSFTTGCGNYHSVPCRFWHWHWHRVLR